MLIPFFFSRMTNNRSIGELSKVSEGPDGRWHREAPSAASTDASPDTRTHAELLDQVAALQAQLIALQAQQPATVAPYEDASHEDDSRLGSRQKRCVIA